MNRLKSALKPALRRSATWLLRVGVAAARAVGVLPRRRAVAGEPRSLLVVSLTPHLGDAVMLLPLLESLRAAYPQAQIECAVERGAAVLLEQAPVDKIHALRLGSRPPTRIPDSVRRVLAVLREFRRVMPESAPDLCVMPRWGDDMFRSNVLAYLTGAPRRIGFASEVASPRLRAPYRDAMLTERVRGGNGLHEVQRFALLLERLGLPPAEPDLCERVLQPLARMAEQVDWPALALRLGIDVTSQFVVLAPGASHPKKVWPMERWAKVMEVLRERGFGVVLLSGPADAAEARALHAYSGSWAVLVAGSTSVVESAALIAHARLFLGSDSGPGHLAGALGTPTVVLYVTTPNSSPDDPYSPDRNRPLGPFVACLRPPRNLAPCEGACDAKTAHCIELITMKDVLAGVDEVLSRAKAAEGSAG